VFHIICHVVLYQFLLLTFDEYNNKRFTYLLTYLLTYPEVFNKRINDSSVPLNYEFSPAVGMNAIMRGKMRPGSSATLLKRS